MRKNLHGGDVPNTLAQTIGLVQKNLQYLQRKKNFRPLYISVLTLNTSYYKYFMILAGLPAITQLSGKSFVTTAPAPMITLLPI